MSIYYAIPVFGNLVPSPSSSLEGRGEEASRGGERRRREEASRGGEASRRGLRKFLGEGQGLPLPQRKGNEDLGTRSELYAKEVFFRV